MEQQVGLFEAKTKFSEICDEVARSRQPVIVTRRGKPLVRILPAEEPPMDIIARREAFLAEHNEPDDEVDFEPAPRSREVSHFELDG